MIVLDTNVLSEAMRSVPDPNVMAWLADQPGYALFTTVITEAEIHYGLAIMEQGRRRSQLEEAARRLFDDDFAGRVLSFDQAAARAFARLAADRRSIGRPISHPDAQIAAIAQVCSARLATRNVDDFSHLGLDLIDPWEPR